MNRRELALITVAAFLGAAGSLALSSLALQQVRPRAAYTTDSCTSMASGRCPEADLEGE